MKTPRFKFDPIRFFVAASLLLAASVLAGDSTGATPDNPAAWKAMAEGGAVVELVPDPAPPLPDTQDTNSLRLIVRQAGLRFGMVCAGRVKTKLEAGQWYDLSFNARTDTRKTFALTVSLESPNGEKVAARTTLPEVGGTNRAHYTVALHIRQPVSKYRIVIALADTGTLWLDDISLVLRKTSETH
jgi:hypothetical protein